MKKKLEDSVLFLLNELDQSILNELGNQQEYQSCLKEYETLTEKIMNTVTNKDLDRCLVLSVCLKEAERREALLKGIAAGMEIKKAFDGSDEALAKKFISSSYLLKKEEL